MSGDRAAQLFQRAIIGQEGDDLLVPVLVADRRRADFACLDSEVERLGGKQDCYDIGLLSAYRTGSNLDALRVETALSDRVDKSEGNFQL